MVRAALEWVVFVSGCLILQPKETSGFFSPSLIVAKRIPIRSITSSGSSSSASGTSASVFQNSRWLLPSCHHYHHHHHHHHHNNPLPKSSSLLRATTPGDQTPPSDDTSTKSNRRPKDMKALLSRAVAKASADRQRIEGKQLNNNEPPSSSPHHPYQMDDDDTPTSDWTADDNDNDSTTTRTTRSTTTTSTDNEDHDYSNDVRSLKQLTQAIDERIYANGPRGTADRGDYPRLPGLIVNARDNMTSLLGFNQLQGDWKTHSFKSNYDNEDYDNDNDDGKTRRRQKRSTYNVAIVFGKKLVNDQVTVEYAARIRTLVRLLKEEKDFRPSLICFNGGIQPGNHVSDADAGYVFFRHLCHEQAVPNLDDIGIVLDTKRRNEEEAVYHLTECVKSKYIPKWLEASPGRETKVGDEFGGVVVQKKVSVHFTLISTEYHLCNINDVHHRSPQRSLLTIMEAMGGAFKDPNQYGYSAGNYFRSPYDSMLDYNREIQDGSDDDYYSYRQDIDDRDSLADNDDDLPVTQGIVLTSWSFQYATYPYIYAKDDAVVFLGKCYLLGEELKPLLVNMKGVVDQKEFFQRDNYLMLASIRRSLVHHVEDLHKPRKRILQEALKAHTISIQNAAVVGVGGGRGNTSVNQRDMIGVLEIALLSLGRCVDLVKPAGLLVSSVPKTDWVKALGALEQSMSEIRDLCDPDRPLHPSGWGKLVDDEVD